VQRTNTFTGVFLPPSVRSEKPPLLIAIAHLLNLRSARR
jgi:hypothetical protein